MRTKTMGPRVFLSFALLWHSAVSLLSAHYLGLAYMFITGHSKGYAYDLGSEKDVSIVFGIILLFIWLVTFLPVFGWLTKRFYREKKILAALPSVIFAVAFAAGISWRTSGWPYADHKPDIRGNGAGLPQI